MSEDKERLTEINKFLKKQNQAVMKMLEGYAALHFFYQQLFTKRSKEEVSKLLFEFIENVFTKIEREVQTALFFSNPQTFEFNAFMTHPAGLNKEGFEGQLFSQTEKGVVGWSITNQKISFFSSPENNQFPHGLLLPLFTPSKTLGMLLINFDSDASFITHETMQILELACSQASLIIDNLSFVE